MGFRDIPQVTWRNGLPRWWWMRGFVFLGLTAFRAQACIHAHPNLKKDA